MTGPEVFTTAEKVRVLGEVLGRGIRFAEPSRDELVAGWRRRRWIAANAAAFTCADR